MKKLLLLLLGLPLALFSEEEFIPVAELPPLPLPPSSLSAYYIHVTETTFRTPSVRGQKLRYDEGQGAFNYVHPFASSCGLILGGAYDRATIDWKENPEFDQTKFDYVTMLIGTYSTHFPRWLWVATLSVDIDTIKLDWGNYALYNGVLYGKYCICQWMTFTAGFIAQIGLNKEKFWPLVGFDFLFAPAWRLGLVYPTDLSLTYSPFEKLSFASAVRFIRTRHRLSDNEPIPQGIVEYHVAGLEGQVIFTPFQWLIFKGFVGTTFNGDLKLTNRDNNDSEHFKFKGSPYAGAHLIAFF